MSKLRIDYNQFFGEVAVWINTCNQKVKKFGGIQTEKFWNWVSTSLAELSERYNNDEVVKRQVIMLWNWLEEKNNQVI